MRTPDGVTRGSYSYIDANGVPQTVNYIADALGFRVQATNLPVAPAVSPVGPVPVDVPLPVVPEDTPEVKAARADFQAAFDAAVAQAEAEAAAEIAEEIVVPLVARKKRSAIAPGYGIPAAPAVVVPVPAPLPVAPPPVVVPAPVQVEAVADEIAVAAAATPVLGRTILPVAPAPILPAATPLVRAAPLGLTPVGPASVIPGPVRTLPLAATAAVRTPLRAALTPAPINPLLAPQAVIPAAQFRAQDELGGFSFGYQGLTSGREETRTPDGVVRGAYSYVDANGVTQTVQYIADALGFRVAASNLPVAPVA